MRRELIAAAIGAVLAGGIAYAGVYTVGAPTEAGSVVLQSGTSGGTVTLGAPSGLAAAVTFTLPASNGTANQVLSTNGSGVTSWAAAGAGNVSTTGTNAYTAGTNTYASGVEIVGPTSTKTAAYTTTAADCGSTIFGNSSTAFTITLLTAAVPVGCTIVIVQQGTATVTVSPVSTTTGFSSVNSYTHTKAQWAVIGVTADTATHWVMSGDGA